MPERRCCSQAVKTAREFEKISRMVNKLNPLQPLGAVVSIDGETEPPTLGGRITLSVGKQSIRIKPTLKNDEGLAIVKNPKVVFYQHSFEETNKTDKARVEFPF